MREADLARVILRTGHIHEQTAIPRPSANDIRTMTSRFQADGDGLSAVSQIHPPGSVVLNEHQIDLRIDGTRSSIQRQLVRCVAFAFPFLV